VISTTQGPTLASPKRRGPAEGAIRRVAPGADMWQSSLALAFLRSGGRRRTVAPHRFDAGSGIALRTCIRLAVEECSFYAFYQCMKHDHMDLLTSIGIAWAAGCDRDRR
jgi:hypothetical protein